MEGWVQILEKLSVKLVGSGVQSGHREPPVSLLPARSPPRTLCPLRAPSAGGQAPGGVLPALGLREMQLGLGWQTSHPAKTPQMESRQPLGRVDLCWGAQPGTGWPVESSHPAASQGCLSIHLAGTATSPPPPPRQTLWRHRGGPPHAEGRGRRPLPPTSPASSVNAASKKQSISPTCAREAARC